MMKHERQGTCGTWRNGIVGGMGTQREFDVAIVMSRKAVTACSCPSCEHRHVGETIEEAA